MMQHKEELYFRYDNATNKDFMSNDNVEFCELYEDGLFIDDWFSINTNKLKKNVNIPRSNNGENEWFSEEYLV